MHYSSMSAVTLESYSVDVLMLLAASLAYVQHYVEPSARVQTVLNQYCLPVPYSATHFALCFPCPCLSSAVCLWVQAGFKYFLLVGGTRKKVQKQLGLSHRIKVVHRQFAGAGAVKIPSQPEANNCLKPTGMPRSNRCQPQSQVTDVKGLRNCRHTCWQQTYHSCT